MSTVSLLCASSLTRKRKKGWTRKRERENELNLFATRAKLARTKQELVVGYPCGFYPRIIFFFISQDFILYFIPFVLDGLEKLKSKGGGGDNRFTIIAIFFSLLSRPAAANKKRGPEFRTKYTADVVTRLSSQCKRGPHFRFAPRLNREKESNLPLPPCKQHARNTTSRKIPCIRERFYTRQSWSLCNATDPSSTTTARTRVSLSFSFSPFFPYCFLFGRSLAKIE